MSFTVINQGKIDLWFHQQGYDPTRFSDLCKKIMMEIMIDGPLHRKEIVERLNRPRTTVYDQLIKLKKIGWIEAYSPATGKRGRPTVFFRSLLNNNGELDKND